MSRAFILPIDGKSIGWIPLGVAGTADPAFIGPSEEAKGMEPQSSNPALPFAVTGSLTPEGFANMRQMTEPVYAIKIGDKELPGAYRATSKENADGSVSMTMQPADESSRWALRAWIEEERKKNANRLHVPRI